MNWEQVIGQETLKQLLKESIADNRVSHAQLLVGKEGYGTLPLALAYAKAIFENEKSDSGSKVDHLNHVDLHFSFPVFTENKNSLSQRLFPEFRNMILKKPYANLEDWSDTLESENKQLFISSDEIDVQNQKFALKSYEGGTKILIIWRVDKMNIPAANKFLKFLEEPPEKTIILLTAESLDNMLPTITSRVQIIDVPRIEDAAIKHFLENIPNGNHNEIERITKNSRGDINDALKLFYSTESSEFDTYFVQWVREAFMVKSKPALLKNIISWASEIALWKKEKQRSFIGYCTEIFRQALMQSYGSTSLVDRQINVNQFNWEKFSKYIHGSNIESILTELSEADYHLERNGNSKIIWTDLGIKLTRYLHRNAV